MMSEVRGVPVTCQPGGRGVRDGAGVRVAAPLLHLRRARLRPSKGHRRIGEAEKGFTHSLSKRITPEGSSSPAEHLSDSTFTPVRVPVSNCSETGLRQLAWRAQHTRLRAGRQRHLGVVLVALRRPPADQAARRVPCRDGLPSAAIAPVFLRLPLSFPARSFGTIRPLRLTFPLSTALIMDRNFL